MGDVEELLGLIKECWPHFDITKENLLRPTQELVVRFYENFIDDYKEKVAYLTGAPVIPDFNVADYEHEEQLFLKLSKLLEKIEGLKFTLADIYQPASVRTKNFFKLCVHFVLFAEYLLNDADAVGASVYQSRESLAKDLVEQQNLIAEINDNANYKGEIIESKSQLEQEYKSVKNAYKGIKLLRASNEKLCAEKKNQIESHKRKLQNAEYELKRLENIEKDLLERRITESDHEVILNTLESLKSELETLDSHDVDIGDGLEHENKVLQQVADCITVLNKFVNLNVENIKKLIHAEDELKLISGTVNKLISTKLNSTKLLKLETENKLTTLNEQLEKLQLKYRTIKEDYEKTSSNFTQEISQLRAALDENSLKHSNIILDRKKRIEKLEGDLDKLKKAFSSEYIRVSKVEKAVADKFKEILLKFKDMGY